MKKAVWLFAVLLLARVGAWEMVTSPRVEVLYPRPALASYAKELDREAEAALDALEPLFGARPGRVVLRVNDRVDFFNAFATTVPRPTVELLAPVPAGGLIDLRSPSITYLLLVHELTHARQLTYTKKPGGKKPFRLGLVTELSAPMPPAWFVEGVATYMESRFTPGGRLDWGMTQGVINGLLSEEGAFPSLAEMSLYTYRDWPSGMTRYLLGVRFVSYLIEKHGWESVLKTLQHYNDGLLVNPPFASAWRSAVGTSLEEEWRSWKAAEKKRQAAYASVALPNDQVNAGTLPALSPSGRLAYYDKGFVWVASADGSGPRRLARMRPQRLWWANENTLLYSRYVREGDRAVSDVFSLDATSGRETRLTHGLHARLAAPAPGGCFYYLRNPPGAPDYLVYRCDQESSVVWRATNGERLLGLATSPGGRVALAVWRAGNTDIALLEHGRLRYLAAGRLAVTPPAPRPDPCAGKAAALGACPRGGYHQHLDPLWNGDYEILFRADEGGVFDLYRLELPTEKLTRVSVLSGGASAAAAAGDRYLAATPGPEGSEIVKLAVANTPVALNRSRFMFLCNERGAPAPPVRRGDGNPPGEAKRVCPSQKEDGPLGGKAAPRTDAVVSGYSPWASLTPYGWLPLPAVYGAQPALEADVFGLDDSGEYSYRLGLGYAPQTSGPLGGAYAYLAAGIDAGVDLVGKTAPLGYTLRVGAWPSGTFGIEAGLRLGLVSAGFWDLLNWRAGLEAGPVWDAGGWRLDGSGWLRLGVEDRDPWGYLNSGFYGGAVGAFGTRGGGVRGYLGGAWKFGGQASLEGRLSGASTGRVATEVRLRYSVATAWRTTDGYLALERLTVAPGLLGWYDGGAGYGAELGVYADTTLFYVAPLSIGVCVGYGPGWWWRIGVGAW